MQTTLNLINDNKAWFRVHSQSSQEMDQASSTAHRAHIRPHNTDILMTELRDIYLSRWLTVVHTGL